MFPDQSKQNSKIQAERVLSPLPSSAAIYRNICQTQLNVLLWQKASDQLQQPSVRGSYLGVQKTSVYP